VCTTDRRQNHIAVLTRDWLALLVMYVEEARSLSQPALQRLPVRSRLPEQSAQSPEEAPKHPLHELSHPTHTDSVLDTMSPVTARLVANW
jgi:hypothetical protein